LSLHNTASENIRVDFNQDFTAGYVNRYLLQPGNAVTFKLTAVDARKLYVYVEANTGELNVQQEGD
jgi:hypothetical protein